MKEHEWATPKAVAIAKDTDALERGRYGPIFPKTPAN